VRARASAVVVNTSCSVCARSAMVVMGKLLLALRGSLHPYDAKAASLRVS